MNLKTQPTEKKGITFPEHQNDFDKYLSQNDNMLNNILCGFRYKKIEENNKYICWETAHGDGQGGDSKIFKITYNKMNKLYNVTYRNGYYHYEKHKPYMNDKNYYNVLEKCYNINNNIDAYNENLSPDDVHYIKKELL
jgi:hypothetical protein